MLMWVITVVLMCLASRLFIAYTGKLSKFGVDLLPQVYSVAFTTAPWFFWGALMSEFAEQRLKMHLREYVLCSGGLLVLFAIVTLWTGRLTFGW
jgi:hypothetical protein